MSESVERERKLHLDVGATAPKITEPYAAGPARVVTLSADYVDSVDRLLVGAGYSLRRRVGGTDEGWHLKLPRHGDSRRELHAPLAAGTDSAHVPRALRAEIAEVVRRAALLPVVQLVTIRSETEVTCDGAPQVTLAVVCDDQVVASTPAGQRDSWRELEIELVDGGADDLDALEAMLREGGAEDAPHGSKIERVASRPDPLPSGARGVVLAHVLRQIGVLQALEGDVRRDVPDSVHQSRVATRRLRSSLETFGDIFVASDEARRLRGELRWLAQMLGGPRDAEILRGHVADDVAEILGEAAAEVPAERVLARLDADHRASHEVLLLALDSRRAHDLSGALVGFALHELVSRDAWEHNAIDDLDPLVARTVGKVEKALRRADDATGGRQVRLLHEVRKRAKAARYAHEAIGSRVDAERWEGVTDALGRYQDTTVVMARVRELADDDHADGLDTTLHEAIIGMERARGAAALDQAMKALERARP